MSATRSGRTSAGRHRASANLDEKQGPFPGDEALFSFNVFKTGSLQTTIGSAVFTCQYYFDKNAFCDVSFQMNGGTLIGAGTLNFNATTFALAITGGYGKYSGFTGDVAADPERKVRAAPLVRAQAQAREARRRGRGQRRGRRAAATRRRRRTKR